MLEDLVVAACNEAIRKSKEMVQAEMSKLIGRPQAPRRHRVLMAYHPEPLAR